MSDVRYVSVEQYEKLQAEIKRYKAALENMLSCDCVYCKEHAGQALKGGMRNEDGITKKTDVG